MWNAFLTLVHEYIHTMEHPTFLRARAATEASGAMGEGFCEYFTKEVLDAELPGITGDAALRALVEDTPVASVPPLTKGFLPKTYAYSATYKTEVDLVLKIKPTVGEDGLRASFFQGHVEALGLTPDGGFATPAPKGTGQGLTPPAGVGTVADLAVRFGVPEAAIKAANPGLGAALPSRIVVPGWREHLVVSAKGGGEEAAETRAQIATQNGVTEAQLIAANPGLDWAALKAGDIVYVDKR